MTFALDKSGNTPLDKTYSPANRTNAGPPQNVLLPQFAGEIIHDTVSGALWKARTTLNSSWYQLDEQ